jgi:crossover junction endodeoxyribonuclease RusA
MAKLRIAVTYSEKIESEANGREHWRPKATRVKRQRLMAWANLRTIERPAFLGPVTIVLTRIAPRELDGDNLQSGFKATRDGVADWLGVDDGDKRLTWQYSQRKGAPHHYGVEIEINGG